MNRYETSIPRVALGLAAIAMSAITLGLSVVLPANVAADRYDAQVLAVSTAPVNVAINPARVNGVADCEQAMAVEHVRRTPQNGDRSS